MKEYVECYYKCSTLGCIMKNFIVICTYFNIIERKCFFVGTREAEELPIVLKKIFLYLMEQSLR